MTITFMGCGNMGQALIKGLLAAGYPSGSIIAVDHDADKLAALQQHSGIQIKQTIPAAAFTGEAIVLAVKPQQMALTLDSLQNQVKKHRPLIISIAAGVPIAFFATRLDSAQAVVRCMPNTPALIGAGITALFANAAANTTQKTIAESILSAVGETLWLQHEHELDAVTALSGSGPAYYFYFLEAMLEAGCQAGLPQDIVKKLCLATAKGAIELAIQSQDSFKELREKVTSKGGTTQAALQVMQSRDIAGIIEQAINAATHRSQELAKQFGESA